MGYFFLILSMRYKVKEISHHMTIERLKNLFEIIIVEKFKFE